MRQVRFPAQTHLGGYRRFFRVGFCHDSLEAQFKLNFSLLYHQKIDFRMFDDMMPWERDAYIGMLLSTVEAENEKIKLENAAKKAAQKTGRK
jgi:hypothetical protein